MTVKDFIRSASEMLAGVTDENDFDALCIVAAALGCSNSEARARIGEIVTDDIRSRAEQMLLRRTNGEPLQYVLGEWEFYGLPFKVGEGVLIPRPETEMLVDLALERIGALEAPVVYDLCSGSGCVGISVAVKCPKAKVYLLEKHEKAFSYLKDNIALNHCGSVLPVLGDYFDPESLSFAEKADVILCNPPYIRRGDLAGLQREVKAEPVSALDGGEDGLDFYRAFPGLWAEKLKEGGACALETGEDQGEAVKEIFVGSFKNICLHRDHYGSCRMITAEL